MANLEGLNASTSYSPSTAGLGSQPSDGTLEDLAAGWQDAMQGAGMDVNGGALMDRDRPASNAVYQPNGVSAPTLENVGDNTSFHSQVVRATAAQVQAEGGKAIMEVPLTPLKGGPGPRIDLVYQMPGMPPVFVDVKTGDRPRNTPLQEKYYPLFSLAGTCFQTIRASPNLG